MVDRTCIHDMLRFDVYLEGSTGWRQERHHWPLRARDIRQSTEYAWPATTRRPGVKQATNVVRPHRSRAGHAARSDVECKKRGEIYYFLPDQ